MSYQVLARKWRPQHFSQLVGQEHVKSALGNALSNNRLHHAYLFTGTRGVGKTTIARIFAKSLNCEQGITATPCGQCSACTEIDAGNFVDLLEIDAASRTKVEDTRDLLDNVQYAPSRGRFKVYLIDEVHMLSRHSFNALLKTLEEPPPHVKFLLATTDPQKLPVTVLSRCLQFNLLALSPLQIEQHLAYVLTQEQIPFVPGALTLLAKAAKGSLRDSLSLTDQAIAQSNANISEDTVRAMLGLLEQSWAQLLLQAVLAQDAGALQNALADLVQQQSNFSQVLDDMLSLLHLTALSQFSQTAASFSELQPFVLQLAETLAPAQVQLYYQLLISGKKELPYAPDPLTGLQMALLRAMAFAPETQQLVAAQPRANVAAARAATPVVMNTPAKSVVSPPQPQVAVPAEQPAAAVAVNTSPDNTAPSPLSEPHQPVVTTAELPEQTAAEQPEPATGIDPVTARIMARRGVQVSSVATPKKTERQQAPTAVNSSTAAAAQPTLAPSHTAQALAARVTSSVPTESPQLPPVAVVEAEPDVASPYALDDDNDVVQPQYDIAATEALWQQYSEDAPEQLPAGQSAVPELTPFDGSITEENFSVRFAAQVDAWAARVETLDTGGLSRLFLLNAAIELDGNKLSLTVAQSQQHLDSGNFRTKLQQVLEQSFNQSLQIDISYQAEVAQSPLSIQQHIVQQRFDYVRTLLQQDENVLQLQQLFNAQLLSDTIKVN
ncbi:DNA polymerase III subunit gamma/tau [Rheinheimera sp.]|uniref:DNA polymerase III subunit gamma/tau n=1 Tax=Rheinheimera sp. TaxID=1869214 RepID=UPI004048BDDE